MVDLNFFYLLPSTFFNFQYLSFYDKPKKHLEKVVIEDFTTQGVVRLKPNLAGIK
jgi:hypothetical protein